MIGLDGVSWDLIETWIKGGKLPFFKRAMDKGVYATNWTTIPCLTSPALPSFITGKNPASTGIFGFRKADGSIMSYNDIKDPAFWDLFAKNKSKIKSLVVNLRVTYPPRIKNGVIVAGTLTPSEESDYVYPKSYKKFFKGFHIEYDKNIKNQRLSEISKNYTAYTKLKFRKFERLFLRNKYPFGLLWIDLTDNIQHYAWKNKEIILEYFKNLEKMIKDFVKRLPSYNIILFSDHGFESVPKYAFHINEWLERKKLLFAKGQGVEKWKNKAEISVYSKLYNTIGWIIYRVVPWSIHNKIYKMVKRFEKKSAEQKKTRAVVMDKTITKLSNLDMNKTKVYLDQKWGLRIVKKNVKDYKAFRDKLIKELKCIKGIDGKSIFKNVYKREEVFKGKYLRDVPDIVFLTKQEYEIRDGFSSKLFKRIRIKRDVVGCHENARNGIFLAYGPDIRRGGKIRDIQIYDLAPTVLHIMGSNIPKDMDGKVLNIFKKDSEPGKRKPRYFKEDERTVIDKIEI